MTYDEVRAVAFTFPSVSDGTAYGAPALKVKGKLLVRLREGLDSIVIAMPFDRREDLMAGDPETYYITDHYLPTNASWSGCPGSTPIKCATYLASPIAR